MLITDLSYLENISENESILGGDYALGITSHALAEGDITYALATASTDIKSKGNGKVIKGNATGLALAIGDDTAIADVDYYAQGFDKVKVKTQSDQGENYAYEYVRVKAKAKPGK